MSHEHFMGPSERTPLNLDIPRNVPFICKICKQPGYGTKNQQTHNGICREESKRRNVARNNKRHQQQNQPRPAPMYAGAGRR